MADYDEMLWKYPFLKFSSKFGTPPPSVPPAQNDLLPPAYEPPDWMQPGVIPPISPTATPPRYEPPDWMQPGVIPTPSQTTTQEETPEGEISPLPKEVQTEKSWLDKPGALESLRSMAESLGNVHVPVAGEVLFNRPGPKPFVAEGIREMIKKRENKLTPEDAKMLNKYMGEDIFAAGQDLNRIKVFMPMLYTSLQNKLAESRQSRSQEFQREQQATSFEQRKALQQNAIEASNTRAEGLEDRETKRREVTDTIRYENLLNSERGRRISDKSLNEVKSGIRAAQAIKRLLNTDDNPTAYRAALIQVARNLAQEKGTLATKDTQAYEGAIGIRGVLWSVEKAATGNYTKQQMDNLREVAAELEDQNKAVLEHMKQSNIESFMESNSDILSRHNFARKDAERSFGKIYDPFAGKVQETSPTVPSSTGKIKVHYTDKSTGNVIQDEIDAAYKDAFLNDKDLLNPGLD
jgi:hypothetical protein